MYPATPHPDQAPASGQDAAPQQMNQNTGQNTTNNNNEMPVFRVNVCLLRTTKAVNYRNRMQFDYRGFPRHRSYAPSSGTAMPKLTERPGGLPSARNSPIFRLQVSPGRANF